MLPLTKLELLHRKQVSVVEALIKLTDAISRRSLILSAIKTYCQIRKRRKEIFFVLRDTRIVTFVEMDRREIGLIS